MGRQPRLLILCPAVQLPVNETVQHTGIGGRSNVSRSPAVPPARGRHPAQSSRFSANSISFLRSPPQPSGGVLGSSGPYPAHGKSRLTPSPECAPSAASVSLVRRTAAMAFRRLALKPPPRRIENARTRLGKGKRQ